MHLACFRHFEEQLTDIEGRLARRGGNVCRRHRCVVLFQCCNDPGTLIGSPNVCSLAQDAPEATSEDQGRFLFLDVPASHIQGLAVLVAVEDQRGVGTGRQPVRAAERFQRIVCAALLGVMQSKHRDAVMRGPMLERAQAL